MSRVSNFIYCINAERIPSPDGKGESINAMGVVPVLAPEFIPGTFSFSIIFSVLDFRLSDDNSIQIRFLKDGSTNPIVDTGVIKLNLPPDQNNDEIPEEYKGINMSMDFRNVIFEEEGVYYTEVIFNGESLIKNHIYVKGKR